MKPLASHISIKAITVVLLSIALSACGFHLRDDYEIPDEVRELSLTSFDKYDPLTRNVDSKLRLYNIEVVPPSDSVPNLHLISENVSERTLSLYQNSKTAEKELTNKTTYRITIPDVGSKTYSITVTRNYLENSSTALAKSVEQDLLEAEMSEQVATLIIRQMARIRTQIEEHELEQASQTIDVNEQTSPDTSDE